jgi:hypothetical protein
MVVYRGELVLIRPVHHSDQPLGQTGIPLKGLKLAITGSACSEIHLSGAPTDHSICVSVQPLELTSAATLGGIGLDCVVVVQVDCPLSDP